MDLHLNNNFNTKNLSYDTCQNHSEFCSTHLHSPGLQFCPANSGVLNLETGQWILAEGANWKYPLGKKGPEAEANHPVTQVSWNDANAYAEWAGRRLPSEIEWEYAAKNGKNSGNTYSWGNQLEEKGSYKANVWQGSFPIKNTVDDGFLYTSPVEEF